MDNNKLMRMAEKTTTIKSLKDLVRVRTNENSVLLLDVSGSMGAYMRNGRTRIEGLRQAVAGIQSKRATPMIAFGLEFGTHDDTGLETSRTSSEVAMVTEVPEAQGMTPLTEAIDFAREKGFGRAVVVSDGAPNNKITALESARTFGGRIDVIFVGDPGDPGSIFLEELAKVTGGQRFEGDLSDVKEIAGAVVGLLNGETIVVDEDDEDDDEDDEDDEEDDEDEDDDA